ncbi:alpha/beta hydrolase [Kribbella sp. NBC_01505]|uniref:alpha/beta fold hydrolase n=1 Tax=Kribbella sp. NBC_01505 TaxID=2903580 RepID=UPI00386C642D
MEKMQVRSSDGTTIGFRQTGGGPGIILLHGGMEHSGDYAELAEQLAEHFSVYAVDRRGRGLSGPHGDHYALAVEVEDVAAVLAATGAKYLFGVSSGATLALWCALKLDSVEAVIAYEPALTIPGHGSDAFIARYERDIARGDLAAAMVTILKGARLGPRFLRLLPRKVAETLVKKLLLDESASDDADEVPFAELIPTQHYDFLLEKEASSHLDEFAALDRPLLLLGGTVGPKYLTAALEHLTQVTEAKQVAFRGLSHAGAANRKGGGRPDLVAAAIRDFLEN